MRLPVAALVYRRGRFLYAVVRIEKVDGRSSKEEG